MKKIYCLLLIINCTLLISNCAQAQAPQAIPYQAVARNNAGNVIASQNISLRFSIHNATAGGSVVYSETHSITTNALGLFTVNIGQGTVVSGTFATIDWGGGSKFIQVEMDATGGSSYTNIGTEKMLSVPYALYSGNEKWNVSGNNIFNTNSGNVGIGTTTPATSALLDISSTSKGFMMPRMTTVQRNAIVSPAIGLQIFNTDNQCINIYDGANWIETCGLKVTGLVIDPNHPTTNSWIQKADFGGTARNGAVGFSIGSKGYIGTGNDGSNKNDFWEWDQLSNTWSQKANFGGTARSRAVGFSIGNKGYIGTGEDGSVKKDFWEWDQTTNTWTQKSDFGGTARGRAVGFSIGSKGYIGTGQDAASVMKNDFWEWDQTTDTWVQKANFGGTARVAAVGFSIGTKGYIGTGNDGIATRKNDFWEWDQMTNVWTQKANFGGTARYQATGFSIGNKGYIGTGNDATNKNDFWEWDQSLNIWTQKLNFGGSARVISVGFSIGNKGYIGTGYESVISSKSDFWEYMDNNITGVSYSSNSISSITGNSVTDGAWTLYNNNIYNANSGNIGIGTNNPTTAKLVIIGNPSEQGIDLSSTDQYANVRVLQNTNSTIDKDMHIGQGSGATSSLHMYSNNSETITLKGNLVGIATTNPLIKLDVAAGSIIGSSATTGSLQGAGNRETKVSFGAVGSDALPEFAGMRVLVAAGTNGCNNTGDIRFDTWECNTSVSREVMRINGRGNVGIGTASPSQRLTVSGNICATGTIGSCSDFRYKRSIIPLSHALDKVMQIQGVSYYWKKEEFPDKQFSDDKQIGVIAQEVEKIYPELVITDADGYKSVDYSKLTPILVEAIKELKIQNDKLESENSSFKSDLEKMKAENASFKSDMEKIKAELGMDVEVKH